MHNHELASFDGEFQRSCNKVFVGRSRIEWNIGLMLNDHSNPYNIIENTTVLSDSAVLRQGFN